MWMYVKHAMKITTLFMLLGLSLLPSMYWPFDHLQMSHKEAVY